MLDLNEIKKNLFNNFNLLIAYSGGLDSTVLLNILECISRKNKKIKLRAIHINHNLNTNSNKWVKHCLIECKKLNIPLLVKNIKINQKNKKGLQATAREKRYKVFFTYLKNKEALVTAHHINDQCETLLLSLKRGSGPLGLSGMSKISIFNKKTILKPFLNYTKNELILFAKKNSLNWIEDESNINIQYDRNFLRKKIIPILTKRWPYFYKNVLRTSELCRETENLIDEIIFPLLLKNIQKNGSLLISSFQEYSFFKINALIRRWIQLHNSKMPSRYTLNRIFNELIQNNNKNSRIQIDNHEIRKYKNAIYWVPIYSVSLKDHIIEWNSPWKPLLLPENLGILYSCNRVKKKCIYIRKPLSYENVTIRFQVKEKIKIFRINKKIKNIWQDFSIPIWERNRIPLLFYNEILIAAINLFITKEAHPKDIPNLNWYIYIKKNNNYT